MKGTSATDTIRKMIAIVPIIVCVPWKHCMSASIYHFCKVQKVIMLYISVAKWIQMYRLYVYIAIAG